MRPSNLPSLLAALWSDDPWIAFEAWLRVTLAVGVLVLLAIGKVFR